MTKKVVFCVPTLKKPYQVTLDSLEASVPLIEASGWDHYMVSEVGCPYISAARAFMLRKALDVHADVIVFIDHDVSWEPQNLATLIDAEGDVVAGLYRFKKDEEEYMGALIPGLDGRPQIRKDGGLRGYCMPAGFLKITRKAVNRFMEAYPELCFGDKCNPSVDLFHHGAHKGVWFGEDYAFARNWRDLGGEIVIMPDMNISHHTPEKEYKGNYHLFLSRQPGGLNAPNNAP